MPFFFVILFCCGCHQGGWRHAYDTKMPKSFSTESLGARQVSSHPSSGLCTPLTPVRRQSFFPPQLSYDNFLSLMVEFMIIKKKIELEEKNERLKSLAIAWILKEELYRKQIDDAELSIFSLLKFIKNPFFERQIEDFCYQDLYISCSKMKSNT